MLIPVLVKERAYKMWRLLLNAFRKVIITGKVKHHSVLFPPHDSCESPRVVRINRDRLC